MSATDCWVGCVGLYQSLEQVENEFLFLDSQGACSLQYLCIYRNVFRLAWAFNMSRNWPGECSISDLWLSECAWQQHIWVLPRRLRPERYIRMGASQGFVTYPQGHTNINFYSINAGPSNFNLSLLLWTILLLFVQFPRFCKCGLGSSTVGYVSDGL